MAFNKLKALLTQIVSVILVLIIISCDKQIDEPGTEIEWEAVGEVDFGENGGNSEFEEISISVEPGVFNSDTKFTIEKSATPVFDSESAITDVFSVEINNQSNSDIEFQVKLKANKTFELADSISLLVGFQSRNLYDDSTSWNIMLLKDIEIEGNEIIGNLKFAIEDNDKSLNKSTFGIIVPLGVAAGAAYVFVQGYKSYVNKPSKSGNFIVYGNWVNKTPSDDVADAFDYSWIELEKLGFEMKRVRATKNDLFWPFPCYLYPEGSGWGFSLAKNESGYFCPKLSRNLDCILIKDKNLKGLTAKRVCGHEFFHAVQSVYNHEDYKKYLWLGEASSNWFEVYLSKKEGKDGYVPNSFLNDSAFYENGLNGVNAKKLDNHGYGYFVFLRYLTDLYGDKIIYDIWVEADKQNSGGYNSAIALENAVLKKTDSPFAVIYQNFILDFFLGKINNMDYDLNDFLNSGIKIQNWDVSKNDITEKKLFTATSSFPDFSANIFKINFSSEVKDIEDIKTFDIELPFKDPNVCAFILQDQVGEKIQIGKMDYIQSQFNLSLANYAGKSVYILIVNANNNGKFNGSKEITVQGKSGDTKLKFNQVHCSISAYDPNFEPNFLHYSQVNGNNTYNYSLRLFTTNNEFAPQTATYTSAGFYFAGTDPTNSNNTFTVNGIISGGYITGITFTDKKGSSTQEIVLGGLNIPMNAIVTCNGGCTHYAVYENPCSKYIANLSYTDYSGETTTRLTSWDAGMLDQYGDVSVTFHVY